MNEQWIEWSEPTGPPPDEHQAWAWIGDQWWLIITDSADGVPSDLSYVDDHKETNDDHG